MTFQSKQEYLAKIKDRYRHAGKKWKARILDEFCEVCGHSRKHAIKLLNKDGRKKKRKPGRRSKYGQDEIRVLEDIWLAADRPCSSRLIGMISLWLPFYEKRNGYLEASVKDRLLNAKARTLDRVLGPTRRKHGSRGLCGTRPGNYLKSNIPIKISHDDVKGPGFIQADTVAHCGGSMEGSFVWSLSFTDIFTGWTENAATWNKGEYGVHQAIERIEDRLPFAMKGFHTDNGGEFINHHLHSYFRDRDTPVEFTRSRSNKKNDNAHVEQKNYTHVRLLLGYQRIENPDLVQAINELYDAAGLLTNFFCANRKLTFKERRGSKYYKRHDKALTPCQRLLGSGMLTEPQVIHLKSLQAHLNPYTLRNLIDKKREKIFKSLRCH